MEQKITIEFNSRQSVLNMYEFLRRVDLKGEEAVAWSEIAMTIQRALNPTEQTK